MSITDQIAPADSSTFWADGACHGLDPELFHPERGASTREARAVCATCAVRPDCLHWAVTTNQHFGVWGGTSERDRRRIRRRLAAGEPVAELDPEWIPKGHGGRPLGSLTPPPVKEKPVDLVIAPDPTAANGKSTDQAAGLPTDVCVNCGRRYTPARKTQRFHSKECARAWYASHPRSENGTRQPRVRQPAAKAKKAAAAPVPTTTATAGPGVDIQALLGQLLAACDRWAIEADLGDIRVSVTRGCRA